MMSYVLRRRAAAGMGAVARCRGGTAAQWRSRQCSGARRACSARELDAAHFCNGRFEGAASWTCLLVSFLVYLATHTLAIVLVVVATASVPDYDLAIYQ
jgi:hypothetical protein